MAHPLYPKLIEVRKVYTAKGHPLLSIMPHVKPSSYNLRKETCFKPKINTIRFKYELAMQYTRFKFLLFTFLKFLTLTSNERYTCILIF